MLLSTSSSQSTNHATQKIRREEKNPFAIHPSTKKHPNTVHFDLNMERRARPNTEKKNTFQWNMKKVNYVDAEFLLGLLQLPVHHFLFFLSRSLVLRLLDSLKIHKNHVNLCCRENEISRKNIFFVY